MEETIKKLDEYYSSNIKGISDTNYITVDEYEQEIEEVITFLNEIGCCKTSESFEELRNEYLKNN